MPVIDVPGRQLGGGGEGLVGVLHLMVRLETGFEATQYLDGFGNGGLDDIDFLEPPGQRPVLFEHAAKLLERGGPDAAQLP